MRVFTIERNGARSAMQSTRQLSSAGVTHEQQLATDRDGAERRGQMTAEEYQAHFSDPTPLSELTGEQWRAEGFKARYGLHHDFQVWGSWGSEDSNWMHWFKSHGLTVNGQSTESVKTLGQLRHLIAALGGEQ